MSARDADPSAPLNRPLAGVAAWCDCMQRLDIPVLAGTADAIEAMRLNEDAIDANSLGELIATDPLMTLKLLVHVCTHRPARVVTDPETVIGALVMMGIPPFFRVFGRQPTIEERLQAGVVPGAAPAAVAEDDHSPLGGLRRVLTRARRASRFALAFAVHRADHHAAAVHQAALLHDFAEMLLWCHAPVLARRIHELQRVDPALRSATVQRVVLNAELPDLQQALMQVWQLPDLLSRITDDRHAEHPSVRSVMLAVRLARHTGGGWDNPAVPDDLADIGKLLNLSVAAAGTLVSDVDA